MEENFNNNSVFKRFQINDDISVMDLLSECCSQSGYKFFTFDEFKDSYTFKHSNRVSDFAVLIGKKIGLSDDELYSLKLGALFHDVGKFGIPTNILNKTSTLSDDEFAKVKTHTFIGTEILSKSSMFDNILPIVEHHHEKYDGNGYPSNLKGEEIPLLARITAIADSFDAMTSNRTYNIPMSINEAKSEMQRCSGKQFDPALVNAFLDILDNNYNEVLDIQNKWKIRKH